MSGAAAQFDRTAGQEPPAAVGRDVAAGRPSLERLPRDIGNRGFARVAAQLARRPSSSPRPLAARPAAAEAAGTRALARAVAGRREGDARHDGELEELEGLDRPTPPRRRLQRLAINQVSLTSGTCGQREVKWIFRLDNPAAEPGYIVQHVQGTQDIANCPGPRSGTMTSTMDFWEAWPIARGATVHPRTTSLGRTDTSQRGPTPGKTGLQVTAGEVKFFRRSVTGDLGDWDVPSSDASSAWGPGRVPTSGRLPSTATQPSWWTGTPVEGPVTREARSEWNCCDADSSRHTSTVTARPVPAAATTTPPATTTTPPAKPAARWWEFWKWF